MSNYKEKIENIYKIIEFYVNIIPTKIIYFLNELKIDQSYIFLSFFLIGIILRLIIHYIKKLNKKKIHMFTINQILRKVYIILLII